MTCGQSTVAAMASNDAHYFAASPDVASDPREVELPLADLTLRFHTDTGVFARDGVDPGTRILLAEGGNAAGSGVLVDLGCGYGPIAVALGRRSPGAVVWAVDPNERARELCRRNAERNGAANVLVMAPDAVPAGPIDELWSNPPIRIGKSAMRSLVTEWLDRLSPTGRAVMVVQKHLGADSFATWLNASGYPTTRICARQAYRILEVRPREAASID